MKDVYQTKTGIKIGLAYERPTRREFTRDEERIQSALLGLPQGKPLFVSVLTYASIAIAIIVAISIATSR